MANPGATSVASMICALTVASLAIAQTEALPMHQRNLAAFNALENTSLKIDFFEVPLSEVLDSLQNSLGVKFSLNFSTQDNDLSGNTLITFTHADDLRVANALESILNNYQCTWSIQDGTVHIISSDASLELEHLNVMAFECGDLAKRIRPIKNVSLRSTLNERDGGVFRVSSKDGSLTMKQLAQKPVINENDRILTSENTDVVSSNERTISPIEQLKQVIQETVDPDSWSVNGGVGSVAAVNNVMIVRQTQTNMREIVHLLTLLRDSDLEN